MQTKGEAAILIVSDMQDPPEMIIDFVKKWEDGFKIVIGVKNKSNENYLMFMLRKLYYYTIRKFGEYEHIDNFTGFGLYDKEILDLLRSMKEPFPYFRGMIAEMGFERFEIPYVQPKRYKGRTKNNFYTLYDIGMLGFVNNSKIPLRVSAFIGFILGAVSFIIAIVYLIYKLIYWNRFLLGTAPILIGIFFFSSVQLFFIGILGEYIGAIYTHIKNRPLVIEKERINFD